MVEALEPRVRTKRTVTAKEGEEREGKDDQGAAVRQAAIAMVTAVFTPLCVLTPRDR